MLFLLRFFLIGMDDTLKLAPSNENILHNKQRNIMTSSALVRDYRRLNHPELWNLSETNTEYLQHFITRKRGAGVSLNTINTYVDKLIVWIREFGTDDVKTLSGDDILDAYFHRMDKVSAGEYSAATLDGDVVALKQFFQCLYGDEKAKEYVPITRKRQRNTRLSTEYINVHQVRAMRDYAQSCGDVRGVALIMTCFGTGARISEILDAKVSDVDIKLHNAVLHVDGKTGQRDIPFVVGMPELVAWLNAHPQRNSDGKPDKDAPLFVTYNTRGRGVHKLSKKRVEAYFAEVAIKAGVPEEIKSSPHAFRHLLATIMAKKLTIKEMNLFFGWSPTSTTALTYIHTSKEDLERNILEINGVTYEDENTQELEWVVQCPSCHTILPAGARWCNKCHMILDPVLAVQMQNITSDMSRKDVLNDYLNSTK